MSFFIRLDKEIRAKISSWSLTPRLLDEIFEHLYEELAENPCRHLVLIPEQEDPLQYSFIIRAEGDPPRDYLFEFSVRYTADEITLIIRDGDLLSLESGPE